MELKEFIVGTILDVESAIEGIKREKNVMYVVSDKSQTFQGTSESGVIEFDVAVFAGEKSESGKDIKFGIKVVSVNADDVKNLESGNYSRIKFSLKHS